MDIEPDTLRTMKKNSKRVTLFMGGMALVACSALTGAAITILVQSTVPAPVISVRSTAQAPACTRETFPAEALRVIDGDTFEARLDLGRGVFLVTHIRLANVDTPEVHGPLEKRDPVRGPAATEFTKQWLKALNNQVEAVVHGDDKYGGRVDATVYPRGGGQSLSDALRQGGHEK